MDTPSLLSGDERCRRISYWAIDWERAKIDSKELLSLGIREGMTTPRPDYGDAAGEKVIELARDRELSLPDKTDQYAAIMHIAALADIICCALRKPQDAPWGVPEPVSLGGEAVWLPECYLSPDGLFLRRVVLVSSWSQDRHYAECRGWSTLGEICAFDLPMQMIVVNLGQHRDGKFHGAWSKGLRHPINKGLRFKRKAFIGKGFKDSWTDCWREDYDQITTGEWLKQMIADDILPDICFRVDVPVPTKENRKMILDLATRKLDRILSTTELPEPCLSVCDFPLACRHRGHCHSQQEPSGRWGFVRIDA